MQIMDSKIEEADLVNEATNNEETRAKKTEFKNHARLEIIETKCTRSERMLTSLICINIIILISVVNWQGFYQYRE